MEKRTDFLVLLMDACSEADADSPQVLSRSDGEEVGSVASQAVGLAEPAPASERALVSPHDGDGVRSQTGASTSSTASGSEISDTEGGMLRWSLRAALGASNSMAAAALVWLLPSVILKHMMCTSSRVAVLLLLVTMMASLALSTAAKIRPVASCAFQLTPHQRASSLGRRRWASSAAFGRTTFRHVRGDLDSWRMTSSPEEAAAASTASDTLPDLEKYRNKNNLDDQVFSAISGDGGLKVTVATIRNLLNEMMIQHTMNPVPGDALGRATLCALLASNGMQEEQMFQLTMKGDGPLRGCVAIVTGKGEARGYVGNPSLGDDFTLKEAVGSGTVQVVKNHPEWPRPYNGITGIMHGDIDRDVGIYLAESEQRSCALAAATAFNGILCTAAGGYLVERLPDCSPDTMAHMERNLAKLVEMNGDDGEALPTNLMLEGKTPVDIATILLSGLGMEPLDQLEPSPKCECSEEKLVRSLRLLPREEVDTILEEEGKVEARCQFCGKVYRMGPEEVERQFSLWQGDASSDEEWKQRGQK
ncbi:hypothetical protein ACHAXT_006331 [Thalassiosira profunda]